jgi:hypothetical protein
VQSDAEGSIKTADLVAFTKDGLMINAGAIPVKAPPAGTPPRPV